MTLLAVDQVLRQNDRFSAVDGISSLVSSFLGPPPNRSLADACDVESMALLDLIWETSCTTKAVRKKRWTLTNYLRSEAHYSRWEFTNAVVTVARNGNVQKLEWLLAHFPGYVVEDSAVEEAAKFGHLNVLQFLHRHCCAVNGPALVANDSVVEKVTYDVEVIWGADTLVLGSENRHSEVVQWLVEHTTSIDELTARKLFADAGKRGDIALLEWLVARGLTYDECSIVRSASTEALEWIVARCNRSSFFSRSSGQKVSDFLNEAVRSAARVGRVDVLVNLFAFVEAYCADKLQRFYCSALDEACRYGQMAVVEWKISHEQSHEGGSRFNAPLARGVLDDAASNGHLQIAKLLYNRYDARACNLQVTMLLAAANGHLDVVEWLYSKFGDQRMFHSRQRGASLGLPWDLENFQVGDLAMSSNV